MADPSSTLGSAFFPYYHPYYHHLAFDQTPSLYPPELQRRSLEPPQSQYPTIAAPSDFGFDSSGDYAHLPVDPVLHELLNEPSSDAAAALSAKFEEIKDVPQACSDVENPMPISAWPAMAFPSPSICNSCQVLREITHTNGLYIWKLQIHGSLGMIAHAVLEKYSLDFSSQNLDHQTFDFSQESMSAVKQFLVGYFEDRKQEGYIVLEDPLWEFYEALSVGYGGSENMDIDTFFQVPPTTTTHSGNYYYSEMNEGDNQMQNEGVEFKAEKIPLSAQRERTGKLRLKDFAGYLHLPIEEAARRMNVCPTVMKKICRRDGLLRWPYRKIRSIQRKISNRSKTLSGNDAMERERARADILDLQQQLARISEAFFD